MKRIVNITKDFQEAENYDILQHISMTPEERRKIVSELKRKVYGEKCPDVRESRKFIKKKSLKASSFSKDVIEFLELLYRHSVKYLIVGDEAVIFYGYARLTGDIELFYENSKENAQNLFNALFDFWKGKIPGIKSTHELLEEGLIVQFGVPPNRIDLMNEITGIKFSDAWKNKKVEKIKIGKRGINIYYIGLTDLIKNKEALQRPKDLED